MKWLVFIPLALLGRMQHELSLKRREAIRPSLKKEYAALCSQNVPVTSLLFGNDLQQQLNNINASNKILQVSGNANKLQKADYKGSFSGSRKRPSDKCYKRSFHSQHNRLNRGEKSKKLQIPPPQEEGGGQELNKNVNELTNIGILQAVFQERNITFN